MEESPAPPEIVALAEERSAARSVRDWATADELRARIEAAGWRVTDFGTAFDLAPARPPDEIENGQVLYGAVDSIPSRELEPPAGPASLVVIAEATGAAVEPVLEAFAPHRPERTQVVVVADRQATVAGPHDELVRTATRFSGGDALAAALRRVTGTVVVVLEPDRLPRGDIVSPCIKALDDPSVAVAGIEGLLSNDLHRYGPARVGDATTLRSGCHAFRRADAITRGPIDGRLYLRGSVAAWLGLLLRDEGPDRPPRRALAIELPLDQRDDVPAIADDHARRARRDAYRIAERFRGRTWLATEPPAERRLVGDRAHEHDHDDDADKDRDAAPA